MRRGWLGGGGWMRMNACGCDAGLGCISEKYTICTCHWVDNPEICRIKVNLSLKMKWIQNISRHNISRSACFVVLPTQHILLKGESHDDLLGSPDIRPIWIFFFQHSISSLTFHLQLFYCMIEWTFVRIIYHYMGLPFLCMLGSLRITGRLLHIFKPTRARSAFIFSIRQFLVRSGISTIPNRRFHFHSLSISESFDSCTSFIISVISANLQPLYKDEMSIMYLNFSLKKKKKKLTKHV